MDHSATEITLENESEIIKSTKKNFPCEGKGENKKYLGDTLREFRLKAGLTQLAVSKACGISVTQYNYYEQGQYFPDTNKLIQICNCINADPLAVFASALDKVRKNVFYSPEIYESVTEAYHKKIDSLANMEITLM